MGSEFVWFGANIRKICEKEYILTTFPWNEGRKGLRWQMEVIKNDDR
jgi:hypothetical protein